MGKIKHILLTGSNGFLGSFVLRGLLEAKFTPILYLRSNSNTWRINDLIDRCEIFRCNGSNDDVKKVFDQYSIDCVVHLATDYGRGKSLAELLKTNLIFPVSLLEEGLKRGLALFINTDSFFAKSQYSQTYLKDYTNSKRFLEQVLNSYNESVKIANLRIEHVYGENDSQEKFFSSVINSLLQNKEFILLTSGEQKRDFTYAKDVADAYLSVIDSFDKLIGYQEFEIGTGRSITVRAFVEKIAAAVGGNTELRFGALPNRNGDIEDSFADLNSLQNISWQPKHSVEEAINTIIIKEKVRHRL